MLPEYHFVYRWYFVYLIHYHYFLAMDERNKEKLSIKHRNHSVVAVVLIVLVGVGNTFSINSQPGRSQSTSDPVDRWKSPMAKYSGAVKKMGMSPWDKDNTMGNMIDCPVDQSESSYPKNTPAQASPDALNSDHQSGEGLSVTNVSSIYVSKDNIKWFITDQGMLNFDGTEWKLYDEHTNLPFQDLKGVTCVVDTGGPILWIASRHGATMVRWPADSLVDALTLNPENSGILSENVIDVASGKNSILWIGTDKGVSALSSEIWLEPDYQMHYTKNMFRDFPITSMATNSEGDSLYVGTAGAGIARVYRDELDAISGASVYAEWGPIIMPSDHILSVFIASDGMKWFGTDKGIASHFGNETLDNWTAYTTEDGLIDNHVQAICSDKEGNMWFGTSGGISVYNGSSWLSYTTDDGLASNNIFSLTIDNEGIVWIGSDVGIASCQNGEFVNY